MLNGSMRDYLLKSYRYPLPLSKKIEDRALLELEKIVSKEKPDLICLTEVKKGKQAQFLTNKGYPFSEFEVKYGKNSLMRKIVSYSQNGNAVISKKELPIKKHFLRNGTKKLLYEVTLPNGTNLFLMHFSRKRKTREKQFEEMNQKFGKIESKIICGDFNTFDGLSEVKSLMKNSNLKLASESPTFPAFKPQKPLDLFLASKSLKTEVEVLDNQLSDHLPVILEIK